MGGWVFGAALGTFAFAASVLGAVVAAAGSGDLSPYTTVGVGVPSAAAVFYLLKRFTDGSIIAVPIADLIRESAEREDKMRDVAKRGQDREDLLWGLIRGKGLDR